MGLERIISGGQTGVDRAALDTALERGIPCGGWCPKGRKAEDGVVNASYPLKETRSADYAQRTEWNVRDSDGTLILTLGPPTGGTSFTLECTRKHKKPVLVFDLEDIVKKEDFLRWMEENKIKVLNVAGPRESRKSGSVYQRARKILTFLLDR